MDARNYGSLCLPLLLLGLPKQAGKEEDLLSLQAAGTEGKGRTISVLGETC